MCVGKQQQALKEIPLNHLCSVKMYPIAQCNYSNLTNHWICANNNLKVDLKSLFFKNNLFYPHTTQRKLIRKAKQDEKKTNLSQDLNLKW